MTKENKELISLELFKKEITKAMKEHDDIDVKLGDDYKVINEFYNKYWNDLDRLSKRSLLLTLGGIPNVVKYIYKKYTEEFDI